MLVGVKDRVWIWISLGILKQSTKYHLMNSQWIMELVVWQGLPMIWQIQERCQMWMLISQRIEVLDLQILRIWITQSTKLVFIIQIQIKIYKWVKIQMLRPKVVTSIQGKVVD